MSTKNVKGFFKQQKNKATTAAKGGISKKSSSSNKKSSASFGSNVAQPSALVSHGSFDLKDDFDENEELLREFDLNMAYGPCLGMTRLARWERANSLGTNPPQKIMDLLNSGGVQSECLWDGRV